MNSSSASPPPQPQISIIIPVYNTENFLGECLQSIVSEDFPTFEVILVNDESPDNSQAIIDDYVRRYSNVSSYYQTHGRQGKARNTGIEKARGKYIFFLDSDDLLMPGALAHYYRLMETHGSDIVAGPARSFKGKRRWIGPSYRYYVREIANTSLDQDPWLLADTSCCNKLYRKSFLIEHNLRFPENIYCEDVHFIYRVYLASQIITLSPQIIHQYRGRQRGGVPSGTQTFSQQRLHDIFAVYGEMLKTFEKNSSTEVQVRLHQQIVKKAAQLFSKLPGFPDGGASFYRDVQATVSSISPERIAHHGGHYTLPFVMIQNGFFNHASAILNYGLIPTVVEDFFKQMVDVDPEGLKALLKVSILKNISTLDRVISHGSKNNYIFVVKRILGRIGYDFRQLAIDGRQAAIVTAKTLLGRYRIGQNDLLKRKIRAVLYTRTIGFFWKTGFLLLRRWAQSRAGQRTWLVGERGGRGCAESGYHFFRYCTKNLRTQHVYYVLKKGVAVPEGFGSRKQLLRYGSIKHFRILLRAECLIFTNNELDVSYFLPPKRRFDTIKTIFLSHGITYYNPGVYYRRIAHRFSMIVAAAEREKQEKITDWSLVDRSVVKPTGYPIFDPLQDYSSRKEILFCPTWRNRLDEMAPEQFRVSDYFVQIVGLLRDEVLHEFLEKAGITLIFRCHFRMAHHLETIDAALPRCIRVETGDSGRSVQQCLKDALLLITDYSSIFWDMAYMKKPIILFQFDRLAFLAERGLHAFSTPDDQISFATIVNQREKVLDALVKISENNFILNAAQQDTIATFFDYFDANNSKRVYREIERLLKSGA